MRRLGVACLALVAACSGDDGSGPGGTLAVAVAPAAVSVAQGAASDPVTVTVTRTGDAEDVQFSLSDLPVGVVGTFSAPTIGATTTTATLTITAAASSAPGTSTLIVRATGSNAEPATTPLGLTIVPAPSLEFTLAAAPAALTIGRGQQASSRIDITRAGGFTGVVALTATAPAGITVSMVPSMVAEASTTAAISVGAAVAPGTYEVVVSGAAAGVTGTRTTTVSVTVPNVPASTVVEFCAAPGSPLPALVAVQDGTGPWTRLVAEGEARYRFGFGSTHGGLAVVRTIGAGLVSTEVLHGTEAEIAELAGAGCASGAAGLTMRGTVTGLILGNRADITIGTSSTSVFSRDGEFTLENVPSGVRDLVAVRWATTAVGPNLVFTADRAIVRRDLVTEDDVTIIDPVDFGSAEAFAPETRTVTVQGAGGDVVQVVTSIELEGGRTSALLQAVPFAGASAKGIFFPASRLEPADLHVVSANALAGGDEPTSGRSVQAYLRAPADVTLALGPPLPEVTAQVIGRQPNVRFRLEGSLPQEYDRASSATLVQNGAGTGVATSLSIMATRSYLLASGGGGSPLQWVLLTPDFSTVAGWNQGWGLVAGQPTDISVTGLGGTNAGGPLGPRPTEGSVTRQAFRILRVTP